MDGEVRRLRENLQGEVDSAALYRTLGEVESDPRIAEVYRRMAGIEEHHARFWQQHLRSRGVEARAPRPSWRGRILALLARRFGAGFVLPTVAGMETADRHAYANQPESRKSSLPADEQAHSRLIGAIMGAAGSRGMEGAAIARLEGRHSNVGGNALRAAVLGANDGLVSNLSLVMGVAGASGGGSAVLVAGFAGLLAGAISMALGEWLSVQSARELYERQIDLEAAELASMPEEEEAELALIYQAKGLPEAEAKALAKRLIADQDHALDTLAREELGVDPDELGGSAWAAAGTSFALFAGGALIPVLPFMLWQGSAAVAGSVGLSGLALFGIGAAITLLTGRGVWFSGLRQLSFGVAAAAVTYAVGHLLGVAIHG